MMARFVLVTLLAGVCLTPGAHSSQAKKAHGKKTAVSARGSHLKSPGKRATLTRSKFARTRKLLIPQVSAATRAAAIQLVENRLNPAESHFENAAALVPFFELLERASATGTAIHLLDFGDSHTASDDWVNAMRTELQARYGVGGPGFVLPGHPFRGYRRFDVVGNSSEGWTPEGTVMHPGDGREGLGGISITAHSPDQTVTIRTSGRILEIHYLQQPDGGQLEFSVDGQPTRTISTNGELGTGIYRYEPGLGQHDYRLRTLSSDPVRLFGWASDERSGITFETLGINGAQASLIRNWDNAIWQQEVASRQPALILLEYGTNEANSPRWEPAQYVADLEDVSGKSKSSRALGIYYDDRPAGLRQVAAVGPSGRSD